MNDDKRLPEPYTPSILVVDDDSDVRVSFRRALEELGYLVTETWSGREALRAFTDRFFDLMILDLSMPGMDGFEVLREARKELPDLKVLVVSSFMGGSLLRASEQLGADMALYKDGGPGALVRAVCKVLSSPRGVRR